MITKKRKVFREFGIVVSLGLLVLIFTILNPNFASVTNILNMGRQVSTIGIMSIGMTFLIILGHFDLSVGSMFALISTIVAVLMTEGVSIPITLLCGIALGAIFGFLNGALSSFCKIPSFIVGLGMLNVYRGSQLLITGAYPVLVPWGDAGFGIDFFAYLGKGKVLEVIPMMFVIFLLLAAIGYLILKKTKFGFRITAVGSSAQAAEIAGVRVNWVHIAGFVFNGIFVAIASMLQLSFIGSVTGQVGTGYELNALSAVIIGGTKMSGGDGTIIGTIIGAFVIGALKNGLVLLSVSAFWQTVVIGAVIIVAVALDKWTVKE